jgi:Type II restriction endonuclease EcoO109I
MSTSVSSAAVIQTVRTTLGVSQRLADDVVEAFVNHVARPFEESLSKLHGRDLAARNPFVYAALGTRNVNDWVDRVLRDKETSAVEGYVGTWMEEVSRITSGGFKPGSGVDLQLDRPGNVIELYAIQSTNNTKNSGGTKRDIQALEAAARPLRTARRHVDLYVGYLFGRKKTADSGGVTRLSSDDFWKKVTRVDGFLPKLLSASNDLSILMTQAKQGDVNRIRTEAVAMFADPNRDLRLDVVLNPPPLARQRRSS